MAFRNKNKLIVNSDKPVVATLLTSFIEYSEHHIREAAKARRRSYISLRAASNDGLSYKTLMPCFQMAMNDALYEACATDTTDAKNKLQEESVKHHLRKYLMAA